MKRLRLRVEPYESNPIDRDGDGIVQEGTAWERPGGTRVLDASGAEIQTGRTSEQPVQGIKIVDGTGKQIRYTPSFQKAEGGKKSGGRSLGERIPTLGSKGRTLNAPDPEPVEETVEAVEQTAAPVREKPQQPRSPYEPAPPPLSGRAQELADEVGRDWAAFAERLNQEGFVVFDYETTGFDTEKNAPVQVGAVKVLNGEVVDSFNMFMDPGVPLGEWALKNLKDENGNPLTDQYLSTMSSANNAHEQLAEFIGDSIIVAHNLPFDEKILRSSFAEADIDFEPSGTIDTLELTRNIIPSSKGGGEGAPSHGLGPLAKYLGIEDFTGWHTADADAAAAAEVLQRSLKYAADNNVDSKGMDEKFQAERYAKDVERYQNNMEKYQQDLDKYASDLADYAEAIKRGEDLDPLSSADEEFLSKYSSRKKKRRPFPRGVPVRQLGGPDSRTGGVFKEGMGSKNRRAYFAARRAGKKTEILTQNLDEYTDTAKTTMARSFITRTPLGKKIMPKNWEKNPSEALEAMVNFMVENSEEVARRAGMVDENGNLTESAMVARQWYDVANDFGTKLAGRYGVRPEVAHAVVAIFSAATDWNVNTAGAANALREMGDNPEISLDRLNYVYEHAMKALNSNIKGKNDRIKERLLDLDKKEKEFKASRTRSREKIEKHRKEVLQEKEKIATLISNRDEKVAELEEMVEIGNQAWLERLGAKPGEKLRDQPIPIIAKYLSASEKVQRNGEPLRALSFDVQPDGSYSVRPLQQLANMRHGPEVYEKIAKILSLGFDENSDDNDLYEAIFLGLGQGNKVRSFFNNISDPNESAFRSVTIDTHQAGLLLGIPIAADDPYIKDPVFEPMASIGGPPMYATMKEATERFARKYGLLPREAQSILWEAQRKLWNSADGAREKKIRAVKRMKEYANLENVSAAALQQLLWVIHAEEFGEDFAEQAAKLYDGDIGDLLPDTIRRS